MGIWESDAYMRTGFGRERKKRFFQIRNHTAYAGPAVVYKSEQLAAVWENEPAQVNILPDSHLLWDTNTLALLQLEIRPRLNMAAWRPHSARVKNVGLGPEVCLD